MQKTVVTLVDDLTGAEGENIQTVEFGLDGVTYEIDLDEGPAKDLRDELEVYISAGRRVSGRAKRGTAKSAAKPAGNREHSQAVRAWAKTQGYEVSDRGRVPSNISQAFEDAHRRDGAHLAAV